MLKVDNSLVNNKQIFINKPQKQTSPSFVGQYSAQYQSALAQYGNYNYPITPQIPQNYTKINTVKSPYGDDVHLYMLKNGQKIAIMPKKGTTIVKTFINSGSMNEKDNKRGISHFIEHSLFNGSSKLKAGELFNQVSKMGAQTNASTNFAQTDYYISSAVMEGQDLQKVIEMQADMVQNPTFSPEMIEKEKGPVTSEISMVNDDIGTIAYNKAFQNLFQIDTNSKNLVAGSIETVNSINRGDVVDYHKRHYTPDNMITVVVGEVDPEKTMELISKNFNMPPSQNAQNQRTSQKLTPIQKSTRVDYISPKDNYALLIGAFTGPSNKSPKEQIALDALSLLLTNGTNSRLSKKLRSINGYASVDSQKIGLNNNDPMALTVAIQAPRNKEQKALDIMYQTLEEAKIYPPTNNEMQVVKNTLRKLISSSFESSEMICELIGTSMLDGDINTFSQYLDMINSLTPQDIAQAAQKYYDLNKVSLVMVHPQGTKEADIVRNYNAGQFAKKVPSFTGRVSFGAKTLDTKDVKEMMLVDNTKLILNNIDSNISYFNWKLTSYESTPKNLASSYVLTELLNNGSIKRTKEQFKNDSELQGIDIAFDSNGFSITANASALAENSLNAMSMMKEAMLNPRFTERDFQIAKQKIESYCQSLGKSASDTLIAQLYPEFFATSASIIEGLKTLTLNDVINHYNHLINNSSSCFVVSAPVKNNPVLEMGIVDKASANVHKFQNIQPKLEKIYQPTDKCKILIGQEERNQAEIFKTYSFKMSGNIEDEIKFELLNTILGGSPSSRLFQDLREQQKLAYRVSSEVQNFADTGILTFSILTTTDDKAQNDIKYDNVQKSLDGFEMHAQKLINEKVTQEELDNAKMALKQQIFKQMEMPESKTALLAMNASLPYGIKRIDEYFKAIDKMTAEDIQQAAKHIFSNQPVISILASPDTINDQMGYLKSLGEIQ